MPELLLALDAGTTGARAMLVDPAGAVLAIDKLPITTHFPGPGLVEQDPDTVWNVCCTVINGALVAAGRRINDVAAIGVTTQRSSVILWDRATGVPVAPMLVWSDLRGVAEYRALRAAGFTGWPQLPSAKLPAAIALSCRDPAELQWGTLDSWLVYKLSGGAAHVTDASCGWMTGYFDYVRGAGWDAAMLAHQHLPANLFPIQVPSWGALALTDARVIGARVPVTALIGDQQAEMVAHGALARSEWKATFGTSGVLMAGTGDKPEAIHATMPPEALAFAGGSNRYCVEGMVITAGSLVDWLCGSLGLFASPGAMEIAAASIKHHGNVVVRPSLAGLGAPHGKFEAQGLLAGLSFADGPAQIARAALQGIAFRCREIADVIADVLPVPDMLPVDGGLSASDTMLQLTADALQRPLRRHAVREGTAYGTALAAGMGAGLLCEGDVRRLACYDTDYMPKISRDEADSAFMRWRGAVAA